MKSYPLVSIIMPAYNAENYIKSALESIINQSYNNLEIIILDDNSNDSTKSIIEKFDDKRIKYFKNDSQLGISKSLNKLLDISNGDYVCRMDSDDLMHINKIELQIDYMFRNDLDLCGTWIKFFDKENKTIKYPVSNIDVRFFMVFGCPFAHPSIIAKREVFNNNRYIQTIAEDYDLWVRLAISTNNYKFGNLPKVLLNYRRHRDQLSADNSEIIKDSISISNKYSKVYITNKKILKDFTAYNFGMKLDYEFTDFYHFIKSIIFLAKKNKVSDQILLKLITSIFFRIKKLKFINLTAVFLLLFKEKISFFDTSIIKIIIIFFLRKFSK
tara:strand:+ start:247 stop:1230 length:984 start_codon:yes stop_codon:yes gene_type:complete